MTGGAGFVGSNLVRKLIQLNHEVVVLDDFSTGLLENVSRDVAELKTGSIMDSDLLTAASRNSSIIVHLAALGSVHRSVLAPLPTHHANATGTLNVLNAARRADARVIFSSSSSVYGANMDIPKNELMWTSPLSPYAASKLAGEGYCSAYSESYGVPTTVFRFFNIFGPWQRPDHDYAAVIPRWIWAAANNEPLVLHGNGTQSRDFTFVGDVVNTIVDAIYREVSHPQPINLAYGSRFTLLEVIKELERIFGRVLEVEQQPRRVADVTHSQNDPTLLNSLFPDIRPVPFPIALEKTVEWMTSSDSAAMFYR